MRYRPPPTRLPPTPGGADYARSFTTAAATAPASAGPTYAGPRGQGTGPAEISLGHPSLGGYLFSNGTNTNSYPYYSTSNYGYFLNLLQGDKTANIGRYGNITVGVPGMQGKQTPLWNNRMFPYGGSYWTFPLPLSSASPGTTYNYPDAYGTPPDISGKGFIGLDLGGRPIYRDVGDNITTSYTAGLNTPYELNLSPRQAYVQSTTQPVNAPFTPAELERVLRANDVDAGVLPPRLLALTGAGGHNGSVLLNYRNEVTTVSSDAPCPGIVVPSPNTTIPKADHPSDLLYAATKSTTNPAVTSLNQYLAPELLAGQRMDINRPFGPGWADNTTTPDQVVDDPAITSATFRPAAQALA